MPDDPAAVALAYHQRTRHAPHAYARSNQWMDWDNQPDPFRRYTGAPVVLLDREFPSDGPAYDTLMDGALPDPAPLDATSISRLFFDSLALSAWKEAGDARWSLRVNPSSGNLHPTEAYLVCGPVMDVGDEPAIYHYHALLHGLERRAILDPRTWRLASADLPAGAVIVGLTSIPWRESWKYGERAFRYCQHDLGHAIACVSLAAAALGWRVRVLDSVPESAQAAFLGIHEQSGMEAELPECLLVVYPGDRDFPLAQWRHFRLPVLPPVAWSGTPAPLSAEHHDWPIIDVAAEATASTRPPGPEFWHPAPIVARAACAPREITARSVFRQRRSAVAMDGRTFLARSAFLRTVERVAPGSPPFDAFPWRPAVHLFVFVHRVEGLAPGLYAIRRDDAPIREHVSATFLWEPVEGHPLYLLRAGDFRSVAQSVSCGQDIASDGAFALGMVADLAGGMERLGSRFYRRLHWEAGAIGQVLYLEAESDGIRATGIGCFFDDSMHDALGIARGTGWKTLYHFTVGGPVEDERLRTLEPYSHLR